MNKTALLTKAFEFAASKHVNQKRKGTKNIPYINHPIQVTNLLAHCTSADNNDLLIAAALHDTIEDTDTSAAEICQIFGEKVEQIVLEVTDNMELKKSERRRLQVEHAPSLSDEAKQIKIADKACNIYDMLTTRLEWTNSMKREYVQWASDVVKGCRGINKALEAEFDKTVFMANSVLGKS